MTLLWFTQARRTLVGRAPERPTYRGDRNRSSRGGTFAAGIVGALPAGAVLADSL